MKKIKKLFAVLLVTLNIAGSIKEYFPSFSNNNNIVGIQAGKPIESGDDDILGF